MPDTKPNIVVELLLLAMLATLWGASYTFIRVGVATIPPITLIAARTLIAGVILAAVIRARRMPVPHDAATWRSFAVQAGLNCILPFTLIAFGVAVGLLVLGERLSPTAWIGLALVVTGVAAMSVPTGSDLWRPGLWSPRHRVP